MITSAARGAAVCALIAPLMVAGGAVGAVPAPSSGPQAPAPVHDRPNVVLVLVDDLDTSLVAQMRSVRRLGAGGVTFENSFVVDSLCCPSRASTLTGMFPHNTGVRLNISKRRDPEPSGGYAAFRPVEDKSFAVSMQDLGYRTGFMGKYLNQYPVRDGAPLPPGWDQWNAVSGAGYQGWGYEMTTTVGRKSSNVRSVSHEGLGDDQYVQTVLAETAVDFIDDAEAGSAPYFLEIAPYATHSRVNKPAHPDDPEFPPALQDRPSLEDPDGNCGGRRAAAATDCSRLNVRGLAGFGQPTDDNRPYSADGLVQYPGWLPESDLERDDIRHLNRDLRNRARMAQSVDRIVKDVVAASEGEPTYIIFTSDNGFRMGQFRLGHGKGSAYAPDIEVPLIVGGSAVPPSERGTSRDEVVMNVDLAPTFEDIAGAVTPTPDRDGTSLLPLVESGQEVPWREMAYVEHVKPPSAIAENPDQEKSTNRVPTYWAVRSADALLVESRLTLTDVTGALVSESGFEYYTGLSAEDGYESINAYHPGNPQVQRMRQALAAFQECAGETCRAIGVTVAEQAW